MTPTQEQIRRAQEAVTRRWIRAMVRHGNARTGIRRLPRRLRPRPCRRRSGVTAEHLTPREVAKQNSDEMKPIAADAMQNQLPIEY